MTSRSGMARKLSGNFTLAASAQLTERQHVPRLWISLLLGLTILNGCTKKQPIRPTPQMNIDSKFWLNVLLLQNITHSTIVIPSTFTVISVEKQNTYRTRYKPKDHITVDAAAGKIAINGQPCNSDELTIAPDEPYVFNLNGNLYRGKLKLVIDPDANSFDAINLVPIEPYLAGVVGSEMPDYWEPEALKAQAIAARTYCLYIKKRFGTNRKWDLRKTQAHQVYLGLKAESPQIWDAVTHTKGRVLTCKQTGNHEDIFPSYYCSICGGHTENCKNVFGDSFEPLTGVPCPYCKNVAKPRFFFWPTVLLQKTYVSSQLIKRYPKLKKLGNITNILPKEKSDYGKFARLTRVQLTGSTGQTASLRAEDLRLAIDPKGTKLKSTIFKIVDMKDKWAFISGRGYGHGVGMCQCGAQEMARKGKTTSQILSYYYPHSKIVKLY